jgi:hypothetical protein
VVDDRTLTFGVSGKLADDKRDRERVADAGGVVTTWDAPTGRGADGQRLTRLPARRLFAFTWEDDHRHVRRHCG